MFSLRRFVVAILLLTAACGSPAPALDAAVSPDAAVDPDAGDGTCGMTGPHAGWEQMPSTCLPRCSEAAHVAFDRCADLTCFYADPAVTGDPTPHATVATQIGPFEVGCAQTTSPTGFACVDWQFNSCAWDTCPNEYARAGMCTSMCDDERTALSACLHANTTAFETCFQARAVLCFPPR